MHKYQINNFKDSSNEVAQDFNGATIGTQKNYFVFKLSPFFIKQLDDFYDVRKALVKVIFYIFLILSIIGIAVALYIFKATQSDMSFNMLSDFIASLIFLVFYNIFNNIFYKEFVEFKKAEKMIWLFIADLIVWYFLINFLI